MYNTVCEQYRVGDYVGYIPQACGTRYADGGWSVSAASEAGADLLCSGITYVGPDGVARECMFNQPTASKTAGDLRLESEAFRRLVRNTLRALKAIEQSITLAGPPELARDQYCLDTAREAIAEIHKAIHTA